MIKMAYSRLICGCILMLISFTSSCVYFDCCYCY